MGVDIEGTAFGVFMSPKETLRSGLIKNIALSKFIVPFWRAGVYSVTVFDSKLRIESELRAW